MATMTLPGPSETSAMFETLFGAPAEVVAVSLDPNAQWLGLCMFTTPDDKPVAVVGADISVIAITGAALADYPLKDAEEAIVTGWVNSDLWDNFAEVGNILTTLFAGDRFPRVLLRWAKQVSPRQWKQLFGARLPTATMRIDVQGYHSGLMTFMALADMPPDSIPPVLDELAAAESSLDPNDGWRPYSFRKPANVNRDVLRRLRGQTLQLTKSMAGAFNSVLKKPIRQELLQFHDTTWEDYAAKIATPSLFISFKLEPLAGWFLLSCPVKLSMVLIDLVLGGTGAPLTESRMPSALDLQLLEELFARPLAEVPSLFAAFATSSVSDMRVDLEPRHFQGAASHSTFLVLWMSTEVAGIEYQSTLGIPMLAVHPYLDAILGRAEDDLDERANSGVRRRLLDLPIEVRVAFRPVSVPAMQLADLRAGDVIVLDSTPDDPLHMACGSLDLAAVRPVTHGQRLTVQITEDTLKRGQGSLPRLTCPVPADSSNGHALVATA